MSRTCSLVHTNAHLPQTWLRLDSMCRMCLRCSMLQSNRRHAPSEAMELFLRFRHHTNFHHNAHNGNWISHTNLSEKKKLMDNKCHTYQLHRLQQNNTMASDAADMCGTCYP